MEALWKLGGAVAGAPDAATTAGWNRARALPVDANLVAAFTGVMERRVLRFAYRGVDREVNPYRLDFVRGRWYLNGFDHVRGEERWYRLSRVEARSARTTSANAFVRPRRRPCPGCSSIRGCSARADPVRARVLVRRRAGAAGPPQHRAGPDRRGAARRIRRSSGSTSPIATGSVRSCSSYLDHAVVLEPAELRDDIVAWLEALRRTE